MVNRLRHMVVILINNGECVLRGLTPSTLMGPHSMGHGAHMSSFAKKVSIPNLYARTRANLYDGFGLNLRHLIPISLLPISSSRLHIVQVFGSRKWIYTTFAVLWWSHPSSVPGLPFIQEILGHKQIQGLKLNKRQ